MKPNIATALRTWTATFKKELSAQLETLRTDEDIYGFAVEVPEDLANLGIISAIGRESKLSGEQAGSSYWLDRRYSPVEWDYDGSAFGASCNQLQEIACKYRHVFISDTCEDTTEGIDFRDALYSACLDVMVDCDSEGVFGHIWFKVIFLSDGEHPIVRKSFNRLNTGRAKKEASLLYNGKGFFSRIAHHIWMLYVRKVRSRKYRRIIKR
jgi:hypothetical protein